MATHSDPNQGAFQATGNNDLLINRVVVTAIIWKGGKVDTHLTLYSDTKIDSSCTSVFINGDSFKQRQSK